MIGKSLRTDVDAGVFAITLTRATEYNTITPELRDELAAAIDAGDADPEAHVILLRAEGPAFCAGYGLDWSTAAQSNEQDPERSDRARSQVGERSDRARSQVGERSDRARSRVWDSVADMRMMGRFVATYMKLWYAAKPTIAAVQGWCVGGGTDLVLCSDIIVAGEGARFGYPPARVWGTPTTAMWGYRMGLERAKRDMLTGGEISARKGARIRLILQAG